MRMHPSFGVCDFARGDVETGVQIGGSIVRWSWKTVLENDILTTSQAAKLLGISVRTAQLLIEGGSLSSWKTPGGHRRVYRDEVLALAAREQKPHVRPSHPAAFSSAHVVLLASRERLPLYEVLSTVGECSVETHSDVYSASFAVGSLLPAAVIVDLNDEHAERLSFLRSVAANPALGHTRIFSVGGSDAAPKLNNAYSQLHISSPEALPAALRAILGDGTRSTELVDSASSFPLAANEGRRLVALERSGLVDTPPEKSFDRLTWLASRILKMPIALITMLTPNRQWFKSRQGLDMTETPRSWAFCNHTILQRDVFAVENLALDARFAGNPAVAGNPHFRFYAGAPVIDPDGFALGSLCVIDYEARGLDQDQTQTLLALAQLASDQVRLRLTNRQLRWAHKTTDRKP